MASLHMFQAAERMIKKPVLVEILTQAFMDDPGMQYICQAEHLHYRKRLSGWFTSTLDMQVANNQPVLYVEDDAKVVAVAVLTLPSTKLKHLSLVRWLMDSTRKAGIKAVMRTLKHLQHLQTLQPDGDFYTLEFIAVHPDYQGNGYGKMLLQNIHRIVEGHPSASGTWLETMNPMNVPLYEHFGYRVTEGTRLSNSHVETFIMLRDKEDCSPN